MTLINLQEIYKQYDIKKILNNVDFITKEGERIALIGKNGAGKSTLLKIISGVLEPDSGKRTVANSIKIEMLEQNPEFKKDICVKEAIENELIELSNAKEEYEKAVDKLANNAQNKELQDKISKLSSFLDFHNAWNLDDKIKRVLQAFELEKLQNRSVFALSGGEQRRVALASLVLKKPDVLLLDEPTNHLDVYMVKFLEEFLLSEKFTLIFIYSPHA